MAIIKYQNEFDILKVGQVATLEDNTIKTRIAKKEILFGRGIVSGTIGGDDVKNITKSKAAITYNVNFEASNSIPMTVNGVAITPVVFADNHAATFANLIAVIDSLTGISAVAGTGREIIITVEEALNNILLSNFVVTGGSTQPVGTVIYSSVDSFEGIAIIRHGQPSEIGGDDKYEIEDVVNVMTKGIVAVEVVSTVAYGDTVYVYNDTANTANQGQFTNVSTNNLLVSSAKFLSSATGTTGSPTIVKIEINQP